MSYPMLNLKNSVKSPKNFVKEFAKYFTGCIGLKNGKTGAEIFKHFFGDPKRRHRNECWVLWHFVIKRVMRQLRYKHKFFIVSNYSGKGTEFVYFVPTSVRELDHFVSLNERAIRGHQTAMKMANKFVESRGYLRAKEIALEIPEKKETEMVIENGNKKD